MSFELLPGIYGGGTEERMRALLDERLGSGRGKCQGELAFDPRDLVA